MSIFWQWRSSGNVSAAQVANIEKRLDILFEQIQSLRNLTDVLREMQNKNNDFVMEHTELVRRQVDERCELLKKKIGYLEESIDKISTGTG